MLPDSQEFRDSRVPEELPLRLHSKIRAGINAHLNGIAVK